ncbi:hypothetical protein ANO14919_096810 [Xylariales sp. No.14919]|nr:hypothetical protein ANO14919_096810 [Xylariales sp. No.14919]
MSSDDLRKYYPYPTEGVIYSEPPSAADLGGWANPQLEGDRVQHEEQEQGLQSYRDELQPQLGLRRAESIDRGSSERYPAVTGQTSSDLGQGTFGVELEFLAVQFAKVKNVAGQLAIVDPHPNESRWHSTKLSESELKYLRAIQLEGLDLSEYMPTNREIADRSITQKEWKRLRYSRTKLTRILRDRGLVVIKWPDGVINEIEEEMGYVPINDFSDSEASDDEREGDFPNSSRLGDFRSNYEYDQSLDTDGNYASALAKWENDYYDYHEVNRLGLYRTRDADIRDLANNRCTISGWPNLQEPEIQRLRAVLEERLRLERNAEKQYREDDRNEQVDPLHVPVPGLKQKYKAWTVTFDPSVDGNGMVKDRYSNTDNTESPFDEYFWFGAEVVSPVLPMKDERSREAIRVACGALRDSLRCHKPMEVSTGLHVHLGHTKGWTLFQAKRFATLWSLSENTLLRLHRKDRDADIKWCAKMREGSLLWRACHSTNLSERRTCAGIPQRYHPEAKRREFEAQMEANVPSNAVSDEFIFYLWQFDSINALNEGLGQNDFCKPGVRWRIRGVDSSLDGNIFAVGEPGTIEVRVMHGTLDADNINNWVIVLEHIVDVVRTFDDEKFKDLLAQHLADERPDRLLHLLGVPDDTREYWRDPKRRDEDDRYWEYPDKDLVDWADPFMVPGHKATHGSFWD